MGILRLASTETKRIDLGDGDYLDVRTDLSKRNFAAILKRIPENYDEDAGFTRDQAVDFTTAVFEALVTGWSLEEEPTVDNYLGLARDAGNLVDTKLVEHFNDLTPTTPERKKSNRSSQ